MKLFAIFALIAIIVLVIIFGPFAIVWALNTLFPVLVIPYNFWTWLSVAILNLTWMYKPSKFSVK